MTNWLYPMRQRRGFVFIDDDNAETPVHYGTFVTGVIEGTHDKEWWVLATTWNAIVPDDRLWLYFGKDDCGFGVVGCADVLDKDDATREVQIAIDYTRTMELLYRPFLREELIAIEPSWSNIRNNRSLDKKPKLLHAIMRRAAGL